MAAAAAETTVIGRYEVVRSLGKGSQGAVYLARDPTLDRFVAVKVLTNVDDDLGSVAEDGTPLEARTSSKLKHPNIVPIFDAGKSDAGVYLVFEFVEGNTLAEVLSACGPTSIEDAVPLIASILEGMSAAHAAGIVHLDLSPRNILLDKDDVPRVMDFGLAQFANATPEIGEFVTGTLRYMAPEHFLGLTLGPWTDVFALGSTFFEIVMGRRAFDGRTLEDIQFSIVRANLDLSVLNELPHGEAFGRFLAGAFEVKVDGRYADCAVMNEAFHLFLQETGLADKVDSSSKKHSTIEFLLTRMQRKQDFPAISSTLSDINRLTGASKSATADKLANVILRDMALTSKLLKLVNSAFYGTRANEITSISDAVVFLGVEKIRMTANSLALFGHLKGDSADLKDSMTKSFFAGLVARHLAKRAKLAQAEEAFISGMCQNLGENLVIYYFSDAWHDINELMQEKRLCKAAASRGVLGVSFAELGGAVASIWNLPESIVTAIHGIPSGAVGKPGSDEELLRDCAVLANELCDIFRGETRFIDGRLRNLIERFRYSVELDEEYAMKLLAAGFEKLKAYAPVFEINVGKSAYCRSLQAWLQHRVAAADKAAKAGEVPAQASAR